MTFERIIDKIATVGRITDCLNENYEVVIQLACGKELKVISADIDDLKKRIILYTEGN